MKVRIGFGLSVQGLKEQSSFATIVDDLERCRFDSLWVAERATGPTLDPFTSIAFAAGRTKRLKFGTGVLVLPGRNPVEVAKQLATIDQLSNGRMLVAVGNGLVDPREEQVFGVPEKERGAYMNEVMPLLRRFWSEDSVDHDGPRFHYEGLNILPKPKQKPLEMWLAGTGPLALKRIGRLADGWYPSLLTPEESLAGRLKIQEAAAEAGREIDPEHFGAILTYVRDGDNLDPSIQRQLTRRPDLKLEDVVAIGFPALRERIKRFTDVGASKFVARMPSEPESWTDEIEALADGVLDLTT